MSLLMRNVSAYRLVSSHISEQAVLKCHYGTLSGLSFEQLWHTACLAKKRYVLCASAVLARGSFTRSCDACYLHACIPLDLSAMPKPILTLTA